MDVEAEKTAEVGTDGLSSLQAVPLGMYQISNTMSMCRLPRFVTELHNPLPPELHRKGLYEEHSSLDELSF